MKKKKKIEVIEESRFLNSDEFCHVIGGISCGSTDVLYTMCGDLSPLGPPTLCALYFDCVEPGNFFICGDGSPYDWDMGCINY